MALALLVDEDTQARRLVQQLQAVGHDVLTVAEVGLNGQPDAVVLEQARTLERVLLTRNGVDFLELHQQEVGHAGILAIYQDAEPQKNMSYSDIVRALSNLEATGVTLASTFLVLNHFRWS